MEIVSVGRNIKHSPKERHETADNLKPSTPFQGVQEATMSKVQKTTIVESGIKEFESWVNGHPDRDRKEISISGEEYSLKDIVELAKEGKSFAEQFVESYLEELAETE